MGENAMTHDAHDALLFLVPGATLVEVRVGYRGRRVLGRKMRHLRHVRHVRHASFRCHCSRTSGHPGRELTDNFCRYDQMKGPNSSEGPRYGRFKKEDFTAF